MTKTPGGDVVDGPTYNPTSLQAMQAHYFKMYGYSAKCARTHMHTRTHAQTHRQARVHPRPPVLRHPTVLYLITVPYPPPLPRAPPPPSPPPSPTHTYVYRKFPLLISPGRILCRGSKTGRIFEHGLILGHGHFGRNLQKINLSATH